MRYEKAIEIFNNKAKSHIEILSPIFVTIKQDYLYI